MKRPWFVYVIRCGDGSFYTGITTDLRRRLREHTTGRGARYTRGRGRLRLKYWEACADQGEALRRERVIKGWGHARKASLERPAGGPA